METISYTLPPDQDGATVRHILKAELHVSSHAISRLTRTENGIRVNGKHARTVDLLHTGDVLEVETGDHRPPRVRPTPGDWPLPVVWEDGHLLVVTMPPTFCRTPPPWRGPWPGNGGRTSCSTR